MRSVTRHSALITQHFFGEHAVCNRRIRFMSIRARRTPHKLRKLLVIDDDAKLLASYRDLLSPYGFEVLTAPDGQDAIPIVEDNPDIQLVILDLAMPKMDGRAWLKWFRETRRDMPVIVISAYKLETT